MTTIKRLIIQVESTFWKYDPEKLDFVFITLQSILIKIFKTKGDNNFRIPHLNKENLDEMAGFMKIWL